MEVRKFGVGWETDLYRLDVKGIHGGTRQHQSLVLRLYRGADPDQKAEKEHRLMIGAAKYGVRTPRLDALVMDSSILDHPFILMEHIPGGTLYEGIRGDRGSGWLGMMAETLARIHVLPWKELIPDPAGPIPQHTNPGGFVESLLESMEGTIDQYDLTDFVHTLDWLRARMSRGSADAPVLVHNDFHPQNILIQDDEAVVIDWSFADVSDPRMDLAWTTMLLAVMIGAEHRAGFVQAYEYASGSNVEQLEFFEVLKFTQRMLTIATWLDDAVEIPVAGISKQAIRGDYRIHVLNPYNRLKEITGLEIKTIEEL